MKMMHYLFMILPIVYLLGNAYVFWRLWSLMSSLPLWGKVSCSILFWLMSLLFVAVIMMRNVAMPQWLAKVMYIGGSSWLVVVLYMVLAFVITDVLRLFVPMASHGYLWALCATLILLSYGYFNYRFPKVEQIKICLNKPLKVDSLKVLAVSDIHLGLGTGKVTLKRYVELINKQNPDVVLIAGDLIDNSIIPVVENHMEEELNAINASMGVYLVPGNHEYISGIGDCEDFLAKTNIKLLKDSIVELPCGVQIVGRDDRFNRKRIPIGHIVEKVDATKPIIMVDHQPYEVAKKDSLGVDIQISGHTHHGQVWPLNLLVDRMYEQSHGYKKWSNSHVYVSSGLSLWGPPFRIGTRSDMAVITIVGDKES